jgi:small-conductance mechanosensitive channel
MRTIFDYIIANWFLIVIPVIVFIVSAIALFWLRKVALDWLGKWYKKINWPVGNTLMPSLKVPLSLLCLILSVYLGVTVAGIPGNWKILIGNGLWSLFVAAVTITLINLASQVTFFYGAKLKSPKRATLITRNIMRIVILVCAVLVVLDIWGVPTSPVLLLIAIVILIALVAFRDSAPNLFASFQLAATQEIKVGDYIKLEGNEEGYVTNISWNTTRLQVLNGSIVLVPNNLLIHRKVINYGRPLKKAKEPFYFNTQTHMAELTGLKARNLQELSNILKKVPDSVIYYHTHHFMEEHQYLIPELSNDFSTWVRDALDNDLLAERLANLNIFEYKNLETFKDKLVSIIEDYIARNHFQREAVDGREFYFMKSVSVILPTTYAAHDLREFVEVLRKISPSSLYFHVFESRLRLNQESNDFSNWLEKSMEEVDLGREVARIDPYSLTLEGLRSALVQTIEKHIK